jgi:hypothetical protein
VYEYSGQDTSLKIGGSYPSLGKLFLFSITSLPGADPSSYSMRTGVPSPRVKRLRYETEYSLLKFKNAAIHLLSLYTFMAWTRSNVPYRICNNTSEKYKLCSSPFPILSPRFKYSPHHNPQNGPLFVFFIKGETKFHTHKHIGQKYVSVYILEFSFSIDGSFVQIWNVSV